MITLREDSRTSELWIWLGLTLEEEQIFDYVKALPKQYREWCPRWCAWRVSSEIAPRVRKYLQRHWASLCLDEGRHENLMETLREVWFKQLTERERLVAAEGLKWRGPWRQTAPALGLTAGEAGQLWGEAHEKLREVRLNKRKEEEA